MTRSRLYRPPWSPLEFGGALAFWLDAADPGTMTPGTGIAQWRDKGPRGGHMAQATGSAQPTLVAEAQGGLPGARFSAAASQLMLGALALTATDLTIYIVARMQNASASSGTALAFAAAGTSSSGAGGITPLRRTTTGESVQSLWNTSSGGNTAITYDTTFLYTIVTTATAVGRSLNGAAPTSAAVTVNAASTISAVGASILNTGAGSTALWDGDIYEVLVVLGTLSGVDLQRPQGGLAHKWGLAGLLPSTNPFATVRP